MQGKAKIIFSLTMAFLMSSMISCFMTLVRHGISEGFFRAWMETFSIAWPFASGWIFIALPIARFVTGRLVSWLDKVKQEA